MYIEIDQDIGALARSAAAHAAAVLRRAIQNRGEARLMAATGTSQLPLLSALVEEDVDWGCVTIFHQDEYIGLEADHSSSFALYLQARLIDRVHPKAFYPVQGTGAVDAQMRVLSALAAEKPMDLSFIGIGENAHVAFNDPPADFETQDAYKIVTLEERCKRQQVREGWFEKTEDVPKQAITLTVSHILRSRTIVTFAPYATKAEAVRQVFISEKTPMVPATVLKEHADWHLYLDAASAQKIICLS